MAVLVAIAIPVFTSQLEKSREATDAANIRSAYAEAVVQILEDPQASLSFDNYTCKQKQAGWQNTDAQSSLESLSQSASDNADLGVTVNVSSVTAGGTVSFSFTPGTSSSSPSLSITAS